MNNINCWEFKKCGKDKTGDCPAYPNGGKVCYLLAGTMCEGEIQGIYAIKIGSCRECDFYKDIVLDKFRQYENETGEHIIAEQKLTEDAQVTEQAR